MSFGEAIRSCFQHSTSWKGRATRSEYWWFYLFGVLVTLPFNIIYQSAVMGSGEVFNWAYFLILLVGLVLLLPGLSVLVRRLHDTNRSGWWFWIALIPLVGGIILLVFMLLPSTPGANQYDA